jgi:hypothetical protein
MRPWREGASVTLLSQIPKDRAAVDAELPSHLRDRGPVVHRSDDVAAQIEVIRTHAVLPSADRSIAPSQSRCNTL